MAGPAAAQSGPQRQQQQILQQQEQRQRAQERTLRNVAPPASGERAPEGAPAGQSGGRCIKIDKIIIDGAPLLPEEERRKSRQKYRGKCLSLLELNEVLRDITNWYVDAGYVTTRAYLREQALGGGTLNIKVIEGRVSQVSLREGGMPRSGANTALPGLHGERLNIRDVEQGLDQINRLQSFDAKVRLEPGKADGQSDIVIDATRGRSWRASATYDNFGLPSTGRREVGATAEVDDLLGLYDFLSVSAGSSDTGANFFSEDDRSSRNFNAYYAVPYGYWTASLSASYFSYQTPIVAQRQILSSSGDTFRASAELQRVIHRDQTSKTYIAAGLTTKSIRNYIEDNLIDVSSHRLTSASLRLSHVRSVGGGVLSLTGTLDRGLPILGGLDDDHSTKTAGPRAEYTKGTVEASFVRPFEFAEQRFQFSTSVIGSASPDTLYATERMSVGGRYTVRGFIEDNIAGDIGGFTRNELVWSLPAAVTADLSRVLGNVDLFVAYDAGWIKSDKRDPYEGGTLQGVAGGLRFFKGALFGELSAEKALQSPNYIDPDSYVFSLRVGMTTDAIP